ncbi:Hemolysin, plasmid [Roseisalinus antarcticus]|uniref:Hemolysin, plasmid n=2 Tax=Roseisalinus antarcticus TaxID=254357 RepID=A0A1Y5TBZ1_9RHOB|nr:Hemolysin, plasmid [Roseisalinus antarcticus]
MIGDDGNDRFLGGSGNDTIFGGNGDDTGLGLAGVDTIYGGAGNDSFSGSTGDDFLFGGAGNDKLRGWTGRDKIEGEEGDDSISGDDGADTLFGGSGNDTIYGGNHADTLYGGSGNDRLYGGDGNNTYYGGGGVADRLYLGGPGTREEVIIERETVDRETVHLYGVDLRADEIYFTGNYEIRLGGKRTSRAEEQRDPDESDDDVRKEILEDIVTVWMDVDESREMADIYIGFKDSARNQIILHDVEWDEPYRLRDYGDIDDFFHWVRDSDVTDYL